MATTHRIARLRGYYFRYAPELVDHDPSVRTVTWGLIGLRFENSVRGKLAGIGQKEDAHAHP